MALSAIIFGVFVALLIPFLFSFLKGFPGRIASISIPLSFFLFFLVALVGGLERYANQTMEWVPKLGVNLSFQIDALSILFGLVISGVGVIVFLFSGSYFSGKWNAGRFHLFLAFFFLAMIGLVTSDNLFILFLFWELTSITSYFLIGFNHSEEKSRKSALNALLVTGIGGLALFAAGLLLSISTGASDISALTQEKSIASPFYIPIVILIFIAVFTKSAQFPFHFWLPGAMEAPSPVSAFLHSAAMVKAGVYLVARLNPILGGTPVWSNTLIFVGGFTAILGAVISIFKNDLKQILAYSTISMLGVMFFLLGIGSEFSFMALLLTFTAHALYKAPLFLSAGCIEYSIANRDTSKLSGLFAKLPGVAIAAVLAVLSAVGFIPFFGFIAKESVLEGLLRNEKYSTYSVLFFTAVSLFTLIAMLKSSFWPFLGGKTEEVGEHKKLPIMMWVPPLMLSLTGLVLPFSIPGDLLTLFHKAVYTGVNVHFSNAISIWHGFTTPFFISSGIILLGVILFFLLRQLPLFYSDGLLPKNISIASGFNSVISGLMKLAELNTKIFQSGYLRHYLITIILFFVLLIGYKLIVIKGLFSVKDSLSVSPYEVIIALLIVVAGVMAVKSKSRLTAAVMVGLVGYGVALFFVIYGAPDLAITQFAIETVMVLIFLLTVKGLPKFSTLSKNIVRYRDIFISALFGFVIFLIVLTAGLMDFTPHLSRYFSAASKEAANGRNIVNVILVDFRGFDTLGEITVLVVAGLGVVALMTRKKNQMQSKQKEGGEQ